MDSSRFSRKRLKPAVSLAAVHRKAKDENQPPKADGKASDVVQLADVRCPPKEEDAAAPPRDSENKDDGNKPAAPFRSRFIRPKPRLDLVQRAATKQPDEAANNAKAVAAVVEQPSLVTEADPQEVVAVQEPDETTAVAAAAASPSPHKGRPDPSSDDGDSVRGGQVEERDLSPVYEKETRAAPVRKRVRRWKTAEIKKNLEVKLENGKPDRSRLTMFDLIYYNPTSNPMKYPEISEGTARSGPDESVRTSNEERLQEESVDEPSAAGAELEEEEVAMPVPQVKVGPDGQIIIDEQSLVIETTGTQKSREDLQNSSVVMDYGNGSTTYNAYSKKTKMKSREWSKEDTLKFYRALQNIGTDFLLMQTFFPKLTRKEIKAKFKKEEKVNKELIDKALQNPLKFNISELEKEFAKMEELNKEKPDAKTKGPRKSRSDPFFKSLDETEKRKRGRPPKKPAKQPETVEKKNPEREASYQWNYDDLVLNSGSRNESPPKAKRAKVSDDNAVALAAEASPKTGRQQQATRSGRIPQPKVMEDFTSLPEEDEEEENEKVEATRPEKSPVPDTAAPPVAKTRGPGRGGARPGRRPRRTAPVVPAVTTPTRYGRVPVRKVFEDYVVDDGGEETPEAATAAAEEESSVPAEEDKQDEVILELDADVVEESVVLSAETSDFTQTLGNLGSLYSDVPPGAVVVLATESPDNPGQQVYKVFMVSGNDRVVPVSLGGADEEALLGQP